MPKAAFIPMCIATAVQLRLTVAAACPAAMLLYIGWLFSHFDEYKCRHLWLLHAPLFIANITMANKSGDLIAVFLIFGSSPPPLSQRSIYVGGKSIIIGQAP